MEKELLQQALNSILHGSTQIVSRDFGNGDIRHEEIRVGDLRLRLVDKIAEKMVATPEFRQHLDKVFSPDVVKKLQEKMLGEAKYSDLPYDVKNRVEREMKDANVEVRSYKIVAEVITPEKNA